MKHVRESLMEFNDYKFFSLFEEEDSKDAKDNLQSKEKSGLSIIDKVTSNFEEFKKDADGDILKYKEFWEENKSNKKAFTETGDVYKLYNSDYVVGVLQLPVEVKSDGSIEGGMGASNEPEEEIIEGKVLGEAEEETSDPALNLNNETPEQNAPTEPVSQDGLSDEPADQPVEQPPIEEPTSEPETEQTDLKTPQTYFVLYDMAGGEREEIFRCGSNNVVKAFNAFYNDIFKGSMKDIISQYRQQQEKEKVEAEKVEKAKVEKTKENKVQKFLSETMKMDKILFEEDEENEFPEDYEDEFPEENKLDDEFVQNDSDEEFLNWKKEVKESLITDYEMSEDDAELLIDIAEDVLKDLFDNDTDSFEAAGELAGDSDLWDEVEDARTDEDEFDDEDF